MANRVLSQAERSEIHSALVDQRDAALKSLSAEDPGWEKRVEDRKNKVAIGRLKIEKDVIALTEIEGQIAALETKRKSIELAISKKMPFKKRGERRQYDDDEVCPARKGMCAAIADICSEIHEAELAKDPTGKKALEIHKRYRAATAKFVGCSTREEVGTLKVMEVNS